MLESRLVEVDEGEESSRKDSPQSDRLNFSMRLRALRLPVMYLKARHHG